MNPAAVPLSRPATSFPFIRSPPRGRGRSVNERGATRRTGSGRRRGRDPAGSNAVMTIGRRPSCDIQLNFQNISGTHCELALKNGVWHLRDLGSTNGVKVNGERTLRRPLRPGDEIGIANHKYTIQYQLPPAARSRTCSPRRRTCSASRSWRRPAWRRRRSPTRTTSGEAEAAGGLTRRKAASGLSGSVLDSRPPAGYTSITSQLAGRPSPPLEDGPASPWRARRHREGDPQPTPAEERVP